MSHARLNIANAKATLTRGMGGDAARPCYESQLVFSLLVVQMLDCSCWLIYLYVLCPQRRTRDRLVSVLTTCGHTVGLRQSPSVVFSSTSDLAVDKLQAGQTSSEEASIAEGLNNAGSKDELEPQQVRRRNPLTHALTRLFAKSLTHALTRLLAMSLTRALTRLLAHSLTQNVLLELKSKRVERPLPCSMFASTVIPARFYAFSQHCKVWGWWR